MEWRFMEKKLKSYMWKAVSLFLQVTVVVGIYQIGVLLNSYVFGYIPSTLYGLMILFVLLYFKILKLEFFTLSSKFVLQNLALFFLPVCIGIMNSFELLQANLLSSIFVISFSTLATIILTSKLIDSIILKLEQND